MSIKCYYFTICLPHMAISSRKTNLCIYLLIILWPEHTWSIADNCTWELFPEMLLHATKYHLLNKWISHFQWPFDNLSNTYYCFMHISSLFWTHRLFSVYHHINSALMSIWVDDILVLQLVPHNCFSETELLNQKTNLERVCHVFFCCENLKKNFKAWCNDSHVETRYSRG